MTDAIDEFMDLIIQEYGVDGTCHNEPDDEAVGWMGTGEPMPLTFGHIRRARSEIDALRAQLATARAKAEALDHIAEMVGEKDDPFAAWEVVDHLQRQAAAALRPEAQDGVASAAKVLEQSKDARDKAFDEMWKVATEQYSLEATNAGGARYSVTGDVINALWYAALRALSQGGK